MGLIARKIRKRVRAYEARAVERSNAAVAQLLKELGLGHLSRVQAADEVLLDARTSIRERRFLEGNAGVQRGFGAGE